jgi:hypothetical protein
LEFDPVHGGRDGFPYGQVAGFFLFIPFSHSGRTKKKIMRSEINALTSTCLASKLSYGGAA